MAKKLKINILGLIENMSGEIFGSHGEETAKRLEIPYLGSIPLSKETAEINDHAGIAFLENSSLFETRYKLVTKIKLATVK